MSNLGPAIEDIELNLRAWLTIRHAVAKDGYVRGCIRPTIAALRILRKVQAGTHIVVPKPMLEEGEWVTR